MKPSKGFATQQAEELARLTRIVTFVAEELGVSKADQSKILSSVTEPVETILPKSDWNDWNRRKKAEKSDRMSADWPHIRREILKRDDHTCRICGSDPCVADACASRRLGSHEQRVPQSGDAVSHLPSGHPCSRVSA